MDLHEYKIMVVDDEPALRKMVGEFLTGEGFLHVVYAGSCREAKEVCAREYPHLILLDVMLPDGDGFTLMQELRRESDAPVLFLSARDEDEDRLCGLGLGADDYITKPFLPKELILRVIAVLKRVYRIRGTSEKNRQLQLGDIRVDLESCVVYRGNGDGQSMDRTAQDRQQTEVTLTAKEYAIIEKLAANRGKIVTIDALCEAVWQEGNYGYENTLIVHIRRLREKIEKDPSHPKYLLTVRGLGYKLV